MLDCSGHTEYFNIYLSIEVNCQNSRFSHVLLVRTPFSTIVVMSAATTSIPACSEFQRGVGRENVAAVPGAHSGGLLRAEPFNSGLDNKRRIFTAPRHPSSFQTYQELHQFIVANAKSAQQKRLQVGAVPRMINGGALPTQTPSRARRLGRRDRRPTTKWRAWTTGHGEDGRVMPLRRLVAICRGAVSAVSTIKLPSNILGIAMSSGSLPVIVQARKRELGHPSSYDRVQPGHLLRTTR